MIKRRPHRRQANRGPTATRQTVRRLGHEKLERRELLAAEMGLVPMAGTMFLPGTDPGELRNSLLVADNATPEISPILSPPPFLRWERSALATAPELGSPITVTWGFVADGTSISDDFGLLNNTSSNLISHMDGIYGDGGTTVVSAKPWFPLFERAFDLWAEESGLSFVFEPNDDGRPVAAVDAIGVLGTRADIRISGSSIRDTGILGYNYFPTGRGNAGFDGDMVINTGIDFYANNADAPGGENRALVNVVAHEIGHGIGIYHVEPINQTKLMEPFYSPAFLGPQEDDFFNANILYGDRLESNDTFATATNLGTLPELAPVTIDRVSIDNPFSDRDFYRFRVDSANNLSVFLRPTGSQYLAGPQNGQPVPVNRLRQNDLAFRVYDASGQVIASATANGLGESEFINGLELPVAGDYFVEVFAQSGQDSQAYELTLRVNDPLEIGPQLLAIRPDKSGLLADGDVLNVAPRDFNLFFKGGANLDESTINSNTVRLIRSGGDGDFDNGSIVVELGYVGLVNPGSNDPVDLQQIVMRPASSASHNPTDPAFAFPDDFYQIQIIGAGNAPLSNLTGDAFAGGEDFVINFRLDRGAQVVAVVPQPVTRAANGSLTQASDQIEVYFDDQVLNLNDANDPKFFRLVDTATTLDSSDDRTLLPQTAVYDPVSNRVTLTFAEPIPEGTYRLDVGSSGGDNHTPETAIRVGTLFDENRFTFNGFLGDFGGGSDNDSDVDFYRMELADGSDLTVDVMPHESLLDLTVRLYQLSSPDNPPTLLQQIETGAGTLGTLTFAITTSGAYFVQITSTDGSTGSYQIDARVSGHSVSASDANSTFSSATDLGSLGVAGLSFAAAITPQNVLLPPRPGGLDEPGHRDIQREIHIPSAGMDPIAPAPVAVRYYHFPPAFPSLTNPGESFLNSITAAERQIVRNLFDLFASESGYQFIESNLGQGFEIGKTDLRAFDPAMPAGAGVAGLGGGRGAIVNASQFQDANRFFGDGFTRVMFHEIGHALGLGHSYELPSLMGAVLPADTLWSDHDIVHLQRIVPPNSTDIDMYRFEVAESGRFTAETFAQRLPNPSLLNTVLTLYRELPDGSHELVARNDRYFGTDSFLELDLEPGVYFVGVTSTGNNQYDPNVPDSGFGGTTDGPYELRLNFVAQRDGVLRDADGTEMDGDGDGAPGGVFQFWFQAAEQNTTIFVDRLNDPLLIVGSDGGNGSLANPYDRLSKALEAAGSRIVVPHGASSDIVEGDSFVINDGQTEYRLTFGSDAGEIPFAGLTSEQIATNIAVAASLVLPAPSTASGRVVRFSGIGQLDVASTPALLNAPNLIRVVGNAGADNDLTTIADNVPYVVGTDNSNNPLRDGAEFLVPQGVKVILDAGTLIKLRSANLDVGTSSINLSRAASSIQILGTPEVPVWLRSYADDSAGGDSDGVGTGPRKGDFGGVVFRGDSDLEEHGIFLNHVTHIDIRHGGGGVLVDSNREVFTPIHIENARPAIRFNHIFDSADASVSANPDSFDDSLGRIGPDILGNFLQNNSINGLFIRIRTEFGSTLDKLSLPGRFNDTDITHVLTENLLINGNPGGPLQVAPGVTVARPAGRLVVDPGVVLKTSGARIEAERGASSVIAEGTPNRPVIFTSLADDRYGGSGTFDTNADDFSVGSRGDWGGIYLGQLSSGSIDNAILSFGGGNVPIEGTSTNFNILEVHGGELRITNSLIRDNAAGTAAGVRNGRGTNAATSIFVRGAQPVIVGNTIRDNAGSVANLNANSLNYQILPDYGRSTGPAEVFTRFADNHGPLIRLNQLTDNAINGIVIRGEELTTESVWDDTDIVHVLQSTVTVGNHHTFSGLRLQSSNSESLVIKLSGANAGFTATGKPLDIHDRIGGTIHVLGRPGFPVVMTHLADDTVGAGFAPNGRVMTNTNNSSAPSTGSVGGWRGLLFDEWSNDSNVAIIREAETPLTAGRDINRTPATAQALGELAPDLKSGDENRRLGFEVHGFISPDDPGDVDVYSFRGTAGTPIWIDIDRTDPSLDIVVEVVNISGTVLARSVRSSDPSFPGNTANAATLIQNPLLGGDFYSQNFRDAGFYYVLPGVPNSVGTYFIRVRSNPQTDPITSLMGKSTGKYQLQVRLRQIDEFPGSTVRYADIRFAQTAIDVRGLPRRSPMIGEAGELPGAIGNTFATAQPLVNLLQTDMAAISISGELSTATDVDWFQFSVLHTDIQVIPGVNDSPGTVAVVFDLDYADALNRPDATVAVYNAAGKLIWLGRESNVEDDRPLDVSGNIDDLSRGSVGSKDPYIGPIHVTPNGTYYVAVMSNRMIPQELAGFYLSGTPGTNLQRVRLEPANTVTRVVEDHIGFQGYSSNGAAVLPETNGIFDISSSTALESHVVPFSLKDVVLYVATDQAETTTSFGNNDHLYTVNPFTGERYLTRVTSDAGLITGVNDVQDIVIRSDGRMYGYQRLNGVTNSVGALVEINPENAAITVIGNDNIPGRGPTPNTGAGFPGNYPLGVANRAEQFTTSDEVDALTFWRRGTTGSAAAPVPVYSTYLVVRETDIGQGRNSKLYRGDASGNAAPAIAGANPSQGLMGDIQPNGVQFASTFLTVSNNADTPAVTTIRIESKIPGEAGNDIQVNITRPNNNNAVVTAGGNTINLQIGGTGGPPLTGAPTAQDIVDAINNNDQARNLVTAVIYSGNAGNGFGANGTVALNLNRVGGLSGPLTGGADNNGTQTWIEPLSGRVTGISFGNYSTATGNHTGNLFGVTNRGEFLEINPNTGLVIRRIDVAAALGVPPTTLQFEGLAHGPQNVEGGAYRNTLFAVTTAGAMYAFDTTAMTALPTLVTSEPTNADALTVLRQIFDSTGDGVADSTSMTVTGMTGGGARPIGTAFSPLDFNLWHPTMKRGNDVGHGINVAPDDSRRPGEVNVNIASPGPGANRLQTQAQGGTSLHFGFEQWNQIHNPDSLTYLTYESGVNAQLGILSTPLHADLSSNTNIRNTYNFPGGALGTLQSGTFSLAGSVAQDRPTLYFNYFLDTENHPGANVTGDVNDPFRDSARVFVSTNGGDTWRLVATNNSALSGADPSVGANRAELPGFVSHLSDAGLNAGIPRGQNQQIVQELMDSTGQWRQARVDLSTFAGAEEVMLRFDFSTAGAMRDPSLLGIDGTNSQPFGEFNSQATPRSIRSLNNAFEGFYIDDIIVGYAERGEMVTGDFQPAPGVLDLQTTGRTQDPNPTQFANSLTGPYQLEIRRVDDVATWSEMIDGIWISPFDTNARHINDLSVTASEGFEGATYSAPLPPVSELRQIISTLLPGTSIPDDPFVNALLPGAFETWQLASAPGIQPISGFQSLASPATFGAMPGLIQSALPDSPSQRVAAVFQTTPAQLGATATGGGLLRFRYSVSSLEDTHGLLLLVDGQPQILVPQPPPIEGSIGEPASPFATGERRAISVEFPFVSENSTLTWIYLFAEDQDLAAGSNRAWIDDILVLQGDRATGFEADRNRERLQGLFMIEANTITNSSIRGINVQPGNAQAGGSVPHPGSTINFPQRNSDRLVPGVVIQNNVISGSSGIRYLGETVTAPQRPVPFGRIVNNTLVGANAGIGVEVGVNSSPTVMNNIVTQFATGIGGTTGLAEITHNYFQANTNNGTIGSDSILRAAGTPLFVDAANRNFYLVSGSAAVDSSLNTVQDRADYIGFKNEIGIPPSPVVAPLRDLYGQLRVDSGGSSGGSGTLIFIDRGAIDRADREPPFAVLLDPIDNDISGVDRDPNLTVVSLADPIVEFFSILLTDGPGENSPFEGTGINPLTVTPDVVTVRRNNRTLVEGRDYVLGFNPSTGEMRLTPLSSLWAPAGVYEITLDNQVIADRAGNLLRNNQPDGSTRFIIILPDVGIDFGDAPVSYGTLLANNGARHALIDNAMPRLGRYVDAESDGKPAVPGTDQPSDDEPSPITVEVLEGTGFLVAGSGLPQVVLSIASAPESGDKIRIDTGAGPLTFELVLPGFAPTAGNIAVRFEATDSPEMVAEKLADAISTRLTQAGNAFSVAVGEDSPVPTITLTNLDDEDGVGIGTLVTTGGDYIVFLRPDSSEYPQYPESTTEPDDVLGFLNPLEPAGTKIAVTVMGLGFLDAWVDFNGNGVFEASEQVISSVPVSDGVNYLTIHTPEGTTDKVTWARFRISPEGGLSPTGLAVGGEVEDHRIQIVNVTPPVAIDDPFAVGDLVYRVNEDETLVTEGFFPSIMANDDIDPRTFTPVDAILVEGPSFASNFSLDSRTGHFTYTPRADYAGLDTFTYYLANQQSAIDADISVTRPVIATVTIDIRPVNDAPGVPPLTFHGLESQPEPATDADRPRGENPLTITAEELLETAVAHNDPRYPNADNPEAPWDESAQQLRVVELILPETFVDTDDVLKGQQGPTVITVADADDEGNVTVRTIRGTLVARFVVDSDPAPFIRSYGSLIDVTYVSDDYLNRDNVEPIRVPTVDSDFDTDTFDFLHFTIEDDALLIDPETIDDDAVPFPTVKPDDTFFGDRLRATQILMLDIGPRNDHPIVMDDLITVGEIGAGLPNPDGSITPIDETTDWSDFFINQLGQPVPVPLEDEILVIPAAFLLRNDVVAQPISTDELSGVNDQTLGIVAVEMVTMPASGGGGVSINAAGDVVFVAPTDYYGKIIFTYVAEDQGIDEQADRTQVVNPLRAIGTVTVVVQPVNDVPIPFDRTLSLVEGAEPGEDVYTFFPELLLGIGASEPAAPGKLTPELVDPFTESEQSLRVVAFHVGDNTVDVADLDDYTLPGTGNGFLELDSAAGGRFVFEIENGALKVATFFTSPDYNRIAPFNPVELLEFTIEDDGVTSDPQSPAEITLPAARSSIRGTLTITVGETNDAPIFTMPEEGFVIDENGGTPVVSVDFATIVAPGPLSALDELRLQSLFFTLTPLNVPDGMMMLDEFGEMLIPTLEINTGSAGNWLDPDGNGIGTATLTVFPAIDAFGFAVYEVTATDFLAGEEGSDTFTPRTTTQTLTITINPVNDAPVTYDRSLSITEAVEVDGEVAVLHFDATRLLQGLPPETPSVEGDFADDLSDLYDETEQTLRVVAFGIPRFDGAVDPADFDYIDVTDDSLGLVDGTGSVVWPTANGGTLTFHFADGGFTHGTYAPAVDYNEETPFNEFEKFIFIVSDDGRTTLPGSGYIDLDGSGSGNDVTITLPEERSAPATVTISVLPANDPPIFSMPSGFEFSENGGAPVIGEDFVNMIAPGAYTALDELVRQNVSFTLVPVNVPEGLMMVDEFGEMLIPTIIVTAGGPDAWVDMDGEPLGLATLTVFPAIDAFGFAVYEVIATDDHPTDPRSTSQLLTITINPVNDEPVTYDRSLTLTEAVEADGEVAILHFDAERLIQGLSPETPSVAGDFAEDLSDLYDETEQTLRVVAFGVPKFDGATEPDDFDYIDVTDDSLGLVDGTGSVDWPTVNGGTFTFHFADGAFTHGTYAPAVDYNQRTPFNEFEKFIFVVSDNGRTTLPGSGYVDFDDSGSGEDVTITLPEERSAPATVTISVLPANDPPIFEQSRAVVDILEDVNPSTLPGFVFDIQPGADTALDELIRQTVSFEIVVNESSVPAGLMQQLPEITPDGTLILYPAPDAVGTAIYVFAAVDAEPGTEGFIERRTFGTFTVNVRPVNDAPQVNPDLANTSKPDGDEDSDDFWSVNASGHITYVLKEDNTQEFGVTQPYVIDVRGQLTGDESRVGLLDVFIVGPANEADGTLGGSQSLRILQFEADTALGGRIEVAELDEFGDIAKLLYTPPTDYNSNLGGPDSFTYIVEDFSDAGETWHLETGQLIQDRLTILGRVEFVLRPVNDAPQFSLTFNEIAVLEDSQTVVVDGFAFDIFGGPPGSAFDEIDPSTGDQVEFLVSPISPGAAGLFAIGPVVSPDGRLTFRPAPDAFGEAIFEIVAQDDGADNPQRGDIAFSTPQTLTINIRPVNDRPRLNTSDPIVFTLNENGLVEDNGTVIAQPIFIPFVGDGTVVGLLDVFDVGPANEAADLTPGGNQTLRITNPIPTATSGGGTLQRVFDTDGTTLIGLNYTPRTNFNGVDTFIYGVIDDGVSANLDGTVFPDPREAFNTVSLIVNALNNPPQFSGAPSISVLEDATTTPIVGQTIINGFVTDIAAGPPGAFDELGLVPGIPGQTVEFFVQPVAGNPANLFAEPPTVSPEGTLRFITVPDANGVAVFTIYAQDSGPHDPPLQVNRSPERTFTITVIPVNDPPTFDLISDQVTVLEDSGTFTSATPFVINISPGPPDEVLAGQTVRFEVTVAAQDQDLFRELPIVTDNGFLRFTPADDAVGITVISIIGIDNEGAQSSPATVTITIVEVNDPPVAGDLTFNGDEDTPLVVTAQSLLDVAFDPDLATNPDEFLSITQVAERSQAGAVIRVLPNGDVEYDPRPSMTLQALRPGQTLVDTFTYRVIDAAQALSNLGTVTINVAGVNDAPTVVDDFVTLNLSGPTVIRPLDNDFDVDGTINPLTLRIDLQPAFGSVTVQNDGTLIYTPFPGFRGTDTIRYSVADDLGARSQQATITIDTNLAPVAVNDLVATFREQAIDINVAANDFDPDGTLDLDSIEIVTQPARGTVIVLGEGFVRYVPDSDFIGIDNFQYTIRDNRGRPSNVAQVQVQVSASELQNPSNRTDVDASGETSPIDALLILNRLARGIQEGFTGSIPIEFLLDELPRRFYDVDGNRFVEPLDALIVINAIARQNTSGLQGEGEGEADLGLGPIDVIAPFVRDRTELEPGKELRFEFGPEMPTQDSADAVADFDDFGNDEIDDLIGLLAGDRETDDDSDDNAWLAIDSVLGQLLDN
ncbi:MAG: tandem-95 repeat protein [Planctomycetaceae bacterium]|nr:MAG: tandem-95 repeat protein [Planctomycetaceae bacterium]